MAYGHGRETRGEPLNNIARIALGSLAYHLAGVQSMYTASYDEVLQTPSEESVKIAIRTQQILAHELGLALTADPLGGSYYVETLTAELEELIRTELAEVERDGGAIACIAFGPDPRRRSPTGPSGGRRATSRASGPWVGVDRCRTTTRTTVVDAPAGRAHDRRGRGAAARRGGGAAAHARAAARRRRAARPRCRPPSRGELRAVVLEAVRAYATVGEIADVLRGVFGEWQPDRTF